jgi:hypothetical protein
MGQDKVITKTAWEVQQLAIHAMGKASNSREDGHGANNPSTIATLPAVPVEHIHKTRQYCWAPTNLSNLPLQKSHAFLPASRLVEDAVDKSKSSRKALVLHWNDCAPDVTCGYR